MVIFPSNKHNESLLLFFQLIRFFEIFSPGQKFWNFATFGSSQVKWCKRYSLHVTSRVAERL